MALTLRSTKGSALTYAEMDANWSGLANGTNWGTITAAVTLSSSLTMSAGQVFAANSLYTAPGFGFASAAGRGLFRNAAGEGGLVLPTISTAPFTLHTSSATFNGQRDDVSFWGYNIQAGAVGGNRVDLTEPSLWHGLEAHYYDGVNRYCEWTLDYLSDDGGTLKRFLYLYINRTTDVGEWQFIGNLLPNATNLYDLGSAAASFRTGYFSASINTPFIDSGSSSTSLIHRAGSGGVYGRVTFSSNNSIGSVTLSDDSGVAAFDILENGDIRYRAVSTRAHSFYTNAAKQIEISNTTSATRYLTLTGSNGGNPTIGVSAGSLAITPAVVTGNSITTSAPSGGTAGAWKFGVASVTSPTSPNRTIELDVGGTIYYLAAKTTNN